MFVTCSYRVFINHRFDYLKFVNYLGPLFPPIFSFFALIFPVTKSNKIRPEIIFPPLKELRGVGLSFLTASSQLFLPGRSVCGSMGGSLS
jgi:hypothetical protein